MSKLFDLKQFMESTGGTYIEQVHKYITWTKYDFNKIESRPKEYGRYFVMRKDGKIHWEVWNSTSWAYNEKSIKWWAKIELPK